MAKPSTKPDQTVATAQDAAPPSNSLVLPGFMNAYEGMGAEAIGADDIETPRIKLLQGLSPELEMHDTARSGSFWHTVLTASLGQSVSVIPIYIEKMAILWNPRESGGGILARSVDLMTWNPDHGKARVKVNKGTKDVDWNWGSSVSASKLLEWGSSDPDNSNSQPAATAMINVVLAFPSHPGVPPAVFTFQRSTIKASKRFLGQLKLVKAPIFGCKFMMASVDDSNSNNQPFKNVQFTPLGLITDADEFGEYLDLHNAYKRIGLRVKDIEGLNDEDMLTPAEAGNTPAY